MFILVMVSSVIIFVYGIFVGMYLSVDIPLEEQEPCKSCEYTEGSPWCIEHCPHEIKEDTKEV